MQRSTENAFLFKLKLLTAVCVLTSFCHYPSVAFATAVSCPNEAMLDQSLVGANVSRNWVFLDLQHPITCNGTASAWEFCYYLPASGSLDNADGSVELYSATIGLWRLEDVFGTDRYVRKMSHNIDIPLGATGHSNQFLCETEYIDLDMPLDVYPGDVVGFYTRSDRDISMRPLSLMSNMTSFGSGDAKFVAQRATDGICVLSPTSALNPVCLNNMAGLVMHVSLVVELFNDPYPEYFTTTEMESTTESMVINQRATKPQATSPSAIPTTSSTPINPNSGGKTTGSGGDGKTDSESKPTTNGIISNHLPASTTPRSSSSSSPPTRPPSPSRPPSSPASLPTTEQRPDTGNTTTAQYTETTSSGISGNSGQTGKGGQKNQGTSADSGRLIIFTAVPVVIVVIVLVLVIIIILVVAMVKCRGRGLIKQGGERGHRHIGLGELLLENVEY